MKNIFVATLALMLLTACTSQNEQPLLTDNHLIETTSNTSPQTPPESKKAEPEITPSEPIAPVSYIQPEGKDVTERFRVPEGYTRASTTEDTFPFYLQHLPLKPDGTKVKYYDGREKTKDVYLAVVDYSLGSRDLQQCADGVIRLRAEYFYALGKYDKITFHFVNGFETPFSIWSSGYGVRMNDNEASWYKNNNNNDSYESFQKYLDIVYAYASTLSLEKELIPKEYKEIAIGDVFIKGGSPGHSIIVVDMATNETTGEKVVALAQSYMPAQDIQILRGDIENSPWFYVGMDETFQTPEWTFKTSDLKTWE